MLRLRRYERMSIENRHFISKAVSLTQNYGSLATNHSSHQKTGINDLSYGIKIGAELSFVLSQSTRLSYGVQTDGHACSAVKRVKFFETHCSHIEKQYSTSWLMLHVTSMQHLRHMCLLGVFLLCGGCLHKYPCLRYECMF